MFSNRYLGLKRLVPLMLLAMAGVYAQVGSYAPGGEAVTVAGCRQDPEPCLDKRLWLTGVVTAVTASEFSLAGAEGILVVVGADPSIVVGASLRLVATMGGDRRLRLFALDELSWMRLAKLLVSLLGLAFALLLIRRHFVIQWRDHAWLHPRPVTREADSVALGEATALRPLTKEDNA